MPCIGWRTKLMMEEKETILNKNFETCIPNEIMYCLNLECDDKVCFILEKNKILIKSADVLSDQQTQVYTK